MIFSYLYKKKATKLRVTFKTFRGKKLALIDKADFQELAKMRICQMYKIDLR